MLDLWVPEKSECISEETERYCQEEHLHRTSEAEENAKLNTKGALAETRKNEKKLDKQQRVDKIAIWSQKWLIKPGNCCTTEHSGYKYESLLFKIIVSQLVIALTCNSHKDAD